MGVLAGAALGGAFRYVEIRQGTRRLILVGGAVVYALVFPSDVGVALLGITAGVLSARDRAGREMLAYTQTFSEMIGGFWIALMATQIRISSIGPLWEREMIPALVYLGTMIGGKLLGVYAAVSSGGTDEEDRMSVGMSGSLPQLFVPLMWMASFGKVEPSLRGLMSWGVLWGSLVFPLIARRALTRAVDAAREA